MQQRYLWFLLLFLPAMYAAGQNLSETNFDHYTTAAGLSDNSVSALAQDATGYVWVATSSGLNRFNGSRFVQFHSNSDPNSLTAEELGGMVWLDQNRLAVFSVGLHIVNTRTGSTHNLFIPYHDRKYQFKFNMIMGALGDDKGNTYVVSRSGFYHFNESDSLVSRFDFYKEKDVPTTHFVFGRELFQLDDRRLLITSVDGFYVYDKEKRQIKKMTADDCPVITTSIIYPANNYTFFQPAPGKFFFFKSESDSVFYVNTIENKKLVSLLPFRPDRFEFNYRSRLIAESDTSFYITGHNSGFYRLYFNPGSGAVKLYPQKYFDAYQCTSLLVDKNKNLWVGTNRGLFHENEKYLEVQKGSLPEDIEKKFPNIRLDDIYVNGEKIYAAARGDAGLFVFDKKTFRLQKQILFNQGSYTNSVRAIISAGNSRLLLGTNSWLLEFDGKTGKERRLTPPKWEDGDWVSDFYKDSQDNIWICSNHNYKYDPRSKTFTLLPQFSGLPNTPFIVDGDRDGNIWMAGHGLVRYNTAANKFDLLIDSFPFIKMPDKQVNAMAVDQQNRVWFNSNNNGLAGYDIVHKTFRHFTRSNGLPDDNIASMIVVGNHLWMTCFSGIACLDLLTWQITSFGKEDGFPDMPIAKGARFFYDGEAKQLYINFSSVPVRFRPDEILRKKSPPKTFIEAVAVNGKNSNFLPDSNITIPWKDNEVRIVIGTINFSGGNEQRFAYRVGNNGRWILLGAQPSFSISNLSAGKHLIQVRVHSPRHRWKDQVKELTIHIEPPLWKQDWFIVLAIVLALISIFFLVKWRISLVRKKEMEKTQIEKLKADQYKSQFELEQISNYFSSSLAGKKTEEEVLWDVAQNLIGRMNYEDCIIYLWNEDQTKMVQKAAFGPKGKPEFISEQPFEVLPGQGIVGHAIATRQPVLVNDTRTDKRYRIDDRFRLSEVCVPIIHNDELLGVIDSEHSLANYFSERDVKILTTIATLIANKLIQIESEQSLQAKQQELLNINEQLAEARLSALQTQMNPHFVFNALNSIKRMILDGDNENASRYLSKFASMIRMTLDQSKNVFVTLEENIEYLQAYLQMEQLRFDESFKYSIYYDDGLDISEITLPSMMIQPLVENAIWHGLMQAEGEKKLRIKFAECNNKLTCIVEDNGIGIRQAEKLKQQNKSPHRSVGLENLRKRIKIINGKYGMDCSLQIIDVKESGNGGTGTRAVLQFNLVNA
jgi:two-component system LytT family sensor kinase